MMLHRFTVPGEPQAWQRSRHNGAQHFTSPGQRGYQRTVAWVAKASSVEKRLTPIEIRIRAIMEPPASDSASRRAQKLSGATPPTKRPDVDNISKMILDALNGIAFVDDAQVVSLTVSKHWGKTPCVHVEIHSVEAMQQEKAA